MIAINILLIYLLAIGRFIRGDEGQQALASDQEPYKLSIFHRLSSKLSTGVDPNNHSNFSSSFSNGQTWRKRGDLKIRRANSDSKSLTISSFKRPTMEHLKIDVKSWISSKHLPDYQLLILPHQESPSLPFDYDSHGSISFSLCNFLSDRDQRFKEYLNLWVEEEEIKSGAEGSNRMELRIIGLNWGVEERSRSIFESQSIDRSCKIDDEIFNDNKIGAKFENEEEEKRLKSVEGRLNEVFKSVDSWNTKVMIRRPETLPEPFLRPFQNQGGAVGNRPLEYLPDGTIKKTKQERLREEEANKSWFAKYWMYILPFAILVMFGGGGNSFEEAKTESKSTPSSSS